MKDIFKVEDGKDLRIEDNISPKAVNVISTQLDSLTYAPGFGADLKYFISSNFQFQNESFKAHLTERLMQHYVNPIDAQETVRSLYTEFTWTVGDGAEEVKGMIR